MILVLAMLVSVLVSAVFVSVSCKDGVLLPLCPSTAQQLLRYGSLVVVAVWLV